jgi:hypothetical protein
VAAIGVATVAALEMIGRREDHVGSFEVEIFGGKLGEFFPSFEVLGLRAVWHRCNKRNADVIQV